MITSLLAAAVEFTFLTVAEIVAALPIIASLQESVLTVKSGLSRTVTVTVLVLLLSFFSLTAPAESAVAVIVYVPAVLGVQLAVKLFVPEAASELTDSVVEYTLVPLLFLTLIASLLAAAVEFTFLTVAEIVVAVPVIVSLQESALTVKSGLSRTVTVAVLVLLLSLCSLIALAESAVTVIVYLPAALGVNDVLKAFVPLAVSEETLKFLDSTEVPAELVTLTFTVEAPAE